MKKLTSTSKRVSFTGLDASRHVTIPKTFLYQKKKREI